MKITLLKSFLLLGAFVCFGLAKAQTVSGTVSDANGPLPGASVVVKGTTNGTQTDFDGNYTINDVAADAAIVFSYIGFSSQEIAVNGQTTINVVLQEDANELDEVVVVGYGTTTKRSTVGAVESVKAEEFNKGVIVNPQQLIQGKTAGVQISTTSGEPGAAVNVRVRGTASVRSNNNPLFVVDGVPLNGANTSAATGGGSDPNTGGGSDIGSSGSLDPLSFLNPNDIASIDILQDAASTAIYGSRGANGVVLITTKSGTSGRDVLEFSSTFSVGYIGNRPEVLSREQFLDAQNIISGGTFVDGGFNTDTYDEIFRTSFTQNYNIAYGGGGENGNYRISMGYQDQEGEVEDSTFDRLTARFNATQRFFDNKLKLSTQATISNIESQRPPITNNPNARGDLLSASIGFDPTQPLTGSGTRDQGFIGGFFQPSNERRNPLALLELTRATSSTLRALINVSAQYRITDNLTINTLVGLDKSTSSAASAESRNFAANGTLDNGRANLDEIDLTNTTWESYLNYNKEFGDDVLDVVLGHSYQEFVNEAITLRAFNFETIDLFQMINNIAGAQQFAANTSLERDELQSFFFRTNYSLNNKFNFSGTVRIDGSSRFGENNQYGTFGAFGASWALDQEEWFPEFFDTFKLRANWGVTGNQEGLGSNQFSSRQRIGVGNQNDPGAIGDVAFDEPDLQWEENEQLSIGVDYGILDNRISGSVNYFKRTTSQFLLQVNSAQPAPQPFVFANVDGDIVNEGVEFTINAIPVQTEDFSWDLNFNITYTDNILENYVGPEIDAGQINGPGLSRAFSQRLANNQPLFSFFTRDWQGLDENGGNIFGSEGAQIFIGESALPDFSLGFTNNFSFKNWDLSLFFNGQFGQSIYNNTRNAFSTIPNLSQGRNVFADTLPLVGVENPFNPQSVSSRFVEDGSFLRLQNVTLGHNFNVGEDSAFSSLRLFLNAQNLFVITDYSGQDPEISTDRTLNNLPSLGIDLTSYPRPTTFSLGVNASF
ncbi:SusC/RagA family TonB-linked outer membrane protein [Allomuricauda sp. R78024]|uniref:SusC/RagA family TonB-linked outer membrane protein n=1 Tax=Allomuricauda sp. R78024 TaxID=3093867 RepID=UPI0037CB1127